MAGLVLREDKDGLATLTLNRPDKLNSINVEMFIELRANVDAIAKETDRVGLVIVRGAGKCFSAGHDLADIAKGERPPRPNFQSETVERLARAGTRLIGVDVPSVDPETSKELPSHMACRRHDIRIIENLVLADVMPGDYELIALPLKLKGLDAAPVRAVLRR